MYGESHEVFAGIGNPPMRRRKVKCAGRAACPHAAVGNTICGAGGTPRPTGLTPEEREIVKGTAK